MLAALCLLTAVSPCLAAPPPAPVPAVTPDRAFYDYDASAPFAATETPLETTDGVRVVRVTYPSLVVTPFAVNNTETGYLFLPPGAGPHPAMLVLPEWLPPPALADEFTLCRGIAHNRIAAFLLVAPYSLMRRPVPAVPEAELLSGNVPQTVQAIRQTVLDCRRGLDYLSRRPDIDPARMGVSGISLGGVIAPLVAGVDRRARVLLCFVGGADVGGLLWENPMFRGMKPEMKRRGYSEDTVRDAVAAIEPSRYLQGFDPANALLFSGRDDVFVTPGKARALARALGGAHIIWLNTGHYGLHLSEAQATVIGGRFLQSRFFPDTPPFTLPNNLPAKTIKLGFLLGGHEGLSPALGYQFFNFDPQGRFSIDGQLTLHGLSAALSARLGATSEVGIEVPLLHRDTKPAPFVLLHIVL